MPYDDGSGESSTPWILIIGIIVLFILLIVVFVVIHYMSRDEEEATFDPVTPVQPIIVNGGNCSCSSVFVGGNTTVDFSINRCIVVNSTIPATASASTSPITIVKGTSPKTGAVITILNHTSSPILPTFPGLTPTPGVNLTIAPGGFKGFKYMGGNSVFVAL